MAISVQVSSLIAVIAAALGRYSSPVQLPIAPTTCLCRFDGDRRTEVERAEFALPAVEFAGPLWAVLLLGLLFGVTVTLIALRCWRSLLDSLRFSLVTENLEPRRPRVLAPQPTTALRFSNCRQDEFVLDPAFLFCFGELWMQPTNGMPSPRVSRLLIHRNTRC